MPKQATGGQASITLVRRPSDALVAVAPSSQSRAAVHQDCEASSTLAGNMAIWSSDACEFAHADGVKVKQLYNAA